MASISLCRFAGCLEDVTETTMRFRDATGRVNQCTHVGWHPFFGVVYVFPDCPAVQILVTIWPMFPVFFEKSTVI